MRNLAVSVHSYPVWPAKCAVCCRPAQDEATASLTKMHGIPLIAAMWTSRSIKYPVCARHKWKAEILNFPERAGYFGVAWSMILIGGILALILSRFLPPLTAVFSAMGVFAAFILYGMTYSPVKLAKVGQHEVVFRFKNKEYANEFSELNSSDR